MDLLCTSSRTFLFRHALLLHCSSSSTFIMKMSFRLIALVPLSLFSIYYIICHHPLLSSHYTLSFFTHLSWSFISSQPPRFIQHSHTCRIILFSFMMALVTYIYQPYRTVFSASLSSTYFNYLITHILIKINFRNYLGRDVNGMMRIELIH